MLHVRRFQSQRTSNTSLGLTDFSIYAYTDQGGLRCPRDQQHRQVCRRGVRLALMPMTESALARRFARLQAEWERVHSSRPRLLYHYTDAQGLLGMIRTQRLWATNIRFMNDPTEVAYAAGLVRRSVLEQGERYSKPLVKDIARGIDALLKLYETEDDKYICCFCEDGDLLSQWRGYGAVGGGYSLGFLASRLGLTAYRTLESPEPVLRRVVYNGKQQRRIIDRWVRAAFVRMGNAGPATEQEKATARSSLMISHGTG